MPSWLWGSSLAEAAGPFQFFSVTPCRIVDTRQSFIPEAALWYGVPRNILVAGQCGVPTTAKAAVLNVTMVRPTQDGFLTIWPFNTPMPEVSTINAVAGSRP